MKLKLVDVVNSLNVLSVLSGKPMAGKLAYVIGKNLRVVTEEFKEYDSARIALLKELGTLEEGTNRYELGDNQDEFEHRHQELIETEIEVNLRTLTLAEADHLELTPADMLRIDWMISE